jgi:hypothetical protein
MVWPRSVYDNGSYLLEELDGTCFRKAIHGNRLKVCFSRAEDEAADEEMERILSMRNESIDLKEIEMMIETRFCLVRILPLSFLLLAKCGRLVPKRGQEYNREISDTYKLPVVVPFYLYIVTFFFYLHSSPLGSKRRKLIFPTLHPFATYFGFRAIVILCRVETLHFSAKYRTTRRTKKDMRSFFYS